MQLRSELLTFLTEQELFDEDRTKVDGLRFEDVIADAAVRWLKRYVETGKLDEAISLASQLRNGAHHLIVGGGMLAQAELSTWEALARIYRGSREEKDYQKAETLLVTANQELTELAAPTEQFIRWSAIIARNYNNLGYLRRIQGQFIAASAAYRKALPHWRFVKLEAEHANTLTNLSFALALSGKFQEARRRVEDALNLRKKLGTRIPLALTYSTWAAIEIQAGSPWEAEPLAQSALNISQGLEFLRGTGLALLVLSEAHRFMSEKQDLTIGEKRELLQDALSEANRALEIFSEEDQEPERRLSALYQRGVTLRQLSRVAESEVLESQYGIEAVEDLQKVRAIARENELWQKHLDASLGLAWTYYYQGSPETLSDFLNLLMEEIKLQFSSYLITKQQGPQITAGTVLDVFSQLGRLEVLQGVIAMNRFEAGEKKPTYPALREAVSHFTLAIAYDELVSESSQGIRRALNTILDQLKGLNAREMVAAFESIAETAQAYDSIEEGGRLWQELEESFGPYETHRRLASQNTGDSLLLTTW
jgi:tetratricopeptide (TPR) repeat protein